MTEHEQLTLSQAMQHLLEECRMVLPGIQALFGFQLIAVLSPGFDVKLTAVEELLPVFPTSADGRRRNPKIEEIRAEQELARDARRRGGLAARGNLLRGRSPGSATSG